jgi:hypothetical protein
VEVYFGALLQNAVIGDASLEVQARFCRNCAVLQQMIANLQRLPDRYWKGRMGEDDHLQTECEDVRIDHRQIRAVPKAGKLAELGKLAPLDAMVPPPRDNRRKG